MRWMREALAEARKCLELAGERKVADVPVGAICIANGQIVARAGNRREAAEDPTAHAEILAIQRSAEHLGRRHLHDVTLYVTLEPCPMCAGAIWLARLGRVVFGANDSRAGACGSVLDIPHDPRLNHRPEVRGGVLREECSQLLEQFFGERRARLARR